MSEVMDAANKMSPLAGQPATVATVATVADPERSDR
jgi:hypothetical protein